jgi:hypothetical protein
MKYMIDDDVDVTSFDIFMITSVMVIILCQWSLFVDGHFVDGHYFSM